VSYVPLENAAQRLQITVDDLLDFHTRGWVYVIHGKDARFLHGHDEYKARFILHLRRLRGLEDHEISAVLLAQEPPYSLDAVDEILARAAEVDGPSHKPVTSRSRKWSCVFSGIPRLICWSRLTVLGSRAYPVTLFPRHSH